MPTCTNLNVVAKTNSRLNQQYKKLHKTTNIATDLERSCNNWI